MAIKAIREMPVWPAHPFENQVPKGLTVRQGEDASGRSLVVVSNQAHKAYSFPLELVKNGILPDSFLERVKTL